MYSRFYGPRGAQTADRGECARLLRIASDRDLSSRGGPPGCRSGRLGGSPGRPVTECEHGPNPTSPRPPERGEFGCRAPVRTDLMLDQREPVGGGIWSCRHIARAVPVGISRWRGTGVGDPYRDSTRLRDGRPRGVACSRGRRGAARGRGASSREVDLDRLDAAAANRWLAAFLTVGRDHFVRGVN